MRIYIGLLFLFCLIAVLKADAQSYCYDCNLDSLTQLKQKAKDPREKIRLLELIVEIRPRISIDGIDELIELAHKVSSFDAEPYKRLRQGFEFTNRKEWENALTAITEAIELFDKHKKVIASVLAIPKDIYNTLNRQEERLAYYQKKLAYYQVHGPLENMASCYYGLGGYYNIKSDFNTAISYYLKSVDLYKNFHYRLYLNNLGVVGNCYAKWGNVEKAKEYFNIALPGLLKTKDSSNACFVYGSLAKLAIKNTEYAEAGTYASLQLRFAPGNEYAAFAHLNFAEIFLSTGRPRLSLPHLLSAQRLKDSLNMAFSSFRGELEVNYDFYRYYKQLDQGPRAERYLLAAYAEAAAAQHNYKLKYSQELSLFYSAQGKATEAFKYGFIHASLRDSLEKQLAPFRIAQYENEKKELAQNNRINALKQESAIKEATIKQRDLILWISGGAILLIVASMVFVYRQFLLNRKTLRSLRKTQRQLIVAEKMASLGELTAGIAHEIQNPLNFVNNFSELNSELIAELKQEAGSGNIKEVLEIADSLDANLQKITHHGKRADAIVKNMLQHSGKSTGDKEPTDINSLVDEFLRLSYHGLRAKDKSFNAILETHFDPAAGIVYINPQEMGRVLLNLFGNAFYSVKEKKRSADASFDPTVSVSTRRVGDHVEISVKDNGGGIPEKVLHKIYQPFFTTKPTGEGTGLGLSLSYDIITKGHGGEMKVETKESHGAEFIIFLPLKHQVQKT